jgi:hypothetical protein
MYGKPQMICCPQFLAKGRHLWENGEGHIFFYGIQMLYVWKLTNIDVVVVKRNYYFYAIKLEEENRHERKTFKYQIKKNVHIVFFRGGDQMI